jgi:hypothetical protein
MNYLDILNSLPVDFFFLVVDPQLDISLPQLKNFYSISNPNLLIKNSGYLLSSPKTIEYINQISSNSGHQVAIIPFKPSAKIDLICKKNKWINISNPAPLNRFFEDKIKFYQLCLENNLPVIDSLIGSVNPHFLSQAEKKFGLPLVLQTHFGWAGNSTHLVSNIKTIFQIVAKNTIAKISPFLTGYSLLNNCCLTKDGLIQSPPALQYTGLKPFTNNPFATVGRQWPCQAPPKIISQVKTITNDFAKILSKYHFYGFFGLDFFVYQQRVYLLECNPRLTASFAFYTDIELKNNLNPLFYFHLLQFANPDFSINIDHEYRFDKPLIGSEVTLKNEASVTIKKFHDFTIFSPKTNPIKIPQSITNKLINEKN